MLLAPALYMGPADAADEDTQASVYLVFDPETGEFITVDDPSVTAQHNANLSQEEVASVAAAVNPSDPASTAGEAGGAPPMLLLIGAAVALLVLGGFVWLRKSRHDAA